MNNSKSGLLSSLVVCISLLFVGIVPAQEVEFTTRLIGFSVARPLDGGERNRFLSGPDGTNVFLEFVLNEGRIVGISPETRIEIVDQSGSPIKELKEIRERYNDEYRLRSSYRDDKKACYLEASRYGIPTGSTTRIFARGEFVAFCGTETEDWTSTVEIKRGAVLDLGEFKLEVDRIVPYHSAQETAIKLSSMTQLERIETIHVIDKEQKEYPGRLTATNKVVMRNREVKYYHNYVFDGVAQADVERIRVRHFHDVNKVATKIDLEVRLNAIDSEKNLK